MDKILLIIQREYITRVRKKAFIVMTLLVPGLIAAMFAVIALVANNRDETMHVVNVVDSSNVYKGKFHDEKFLKFNYPDKTLKAAKADLKNEDDMVLYIP